MKPSFHTFAETILPASFYIFAPSFCDTKVCPVGGARGKVIGGGGHHNHLFIFFPTWILGKFQRTWPWELTLVFNNKTLYLPRISSFKSWVNPSALTLSAAESLFCGCFTDSVSEVLCVSMLSLDTDRISSVPSFNQKPLCCVFTCKGSVENQVCRICTSSRLLVVKNQTGRPKLILKGVREKSKSRAGRTKAVRLRHDRRCGKERMEMGRYINWMWNDGRVHLRPEVWRDLSQVHSREAASKHESTKITFAFRWCLKEESFPTNLPHRDSIQ